MIDLKQLLLILPNLGPSRAGRFLAPLNTAMAAWDINTPQREAAFLAQIAHESGGLTRWREIASGKAYEGRADLGNIFPGDGPKYKGGGPIQLTGRANYRKAGRAIKVNLEAHPELIMRPEVGFAVAGWFWTREKKLNALADLGIPQAFIAITRRINGGLNGLRSRQMYWTRAKKALGIS